MLVSAEVNRDAVEISKLLVKEEDIQFDHNETQQIVIPKGFIKPLLIQIHLDQHCPTLSKLKKVFERYFHGFRTQDVFQEITEDCPRCQARKKFPKELKHFKSGTDPSSPGEIFVKDPNNWCLSQEIPSQTL